MPKGNIAYALASFIMGLVFIIIIQFMAPHMMSIFDEMGQPLIEGQPDSSILGAWEPFVRAVWLLFVLGLSLILILIMPIYYISTINDPEGS